MDWEAALNQKYRKKLKFDYGCNYHNRRNFDPSDQVIIALDLMEATLRRPHSDAIALTRAVAYYDLDRLSLEQCKVLFDRVIRIPYHFHVFLLTVWNTRNQRCVYTSLCCVKDDFNQNW